MALGVGGMIMAMVMVMVMVEVEVRVRVRICRMADARTPVIAPAERLAGLEVHELGQRVAHLQWGVWGRQAGCVRARGGL